MHPVQGEAFEVKSPEPGGVGARRSHPGRREGSPVNLVVWIALGLITGLVANRLLNKRGEGLLLSLGLGLVGALIGGYLCNLLAPDHASGLTFWNVVVALVGASALLGIKHAYLGSHPART